MWVSQLSTFSCGDPKNFFELSLYIITSRSFEIISKLHQKYIEDFGLKPKTSYIIDIGSNDGIALKPFKEKKF